MNRFFEKFAKYSALVFAVCVALQLLVIFGLYFTRFSTSTDGAEVVLLTVPVDPRDFLRGDYVRLEYEISNLSWEFFSERKSVGDVPRQGETVYVELERDCLDPSCVYWQAAGVSREKPSSGVFIRGRVKNITEDYYGEYGDFTYGHDMEIEYGIEKYFVESGKGGELERGILAVTVAVDEDGNAAIKHAESLNEDLGDIDDIDFDSGFDEEAWDESDLIRDGEMPYDDYTTDEYDTRP